MPQLTAAEIASQRQHPHRLGDAQYLYVYRPSIIFAAQVAGPGGADPGYEQNIPFDNVTIGDVTAVQRGYTLQIGSAPGLRDYGIVRVRADGNPGDTTINVSEHETYILNDVFISALCEYRLWHISPYVDTTGPTWYKDCDDITAPTAIAFPANDDDIYQPCPVMGPHSITFLSEAGIATHNFDWRNSWTISPNSGTLTYAATFPGGTPPNSAASNGTVTWNTAGERWVTLSLTDDMGVNPNVTAYDAHRLYVTLDRDNLPDNVYLDFVPSPRIGSIDRGGFTMRFTVYTDASEEDFPDEALVMWFFDDGTQADIGGNWPHRSHIKFIGYITKASTHKEPETGAVRFEATTIQGLMKTSPVFPNFMEDDATPTEWTEAHSLTVQRAAYLHMRWMSSLLEMADVLFVPAATTTIGEHEFPEGNLYSQLDGLVNRDYQYRIGCDPLGTVYFNKDPQFLNRPAAYQPPAGIDTIMTIEPQDWRQELDLPEPLLPQVGYILASGNAYAAGAVTSLFSNAPGPVPLERGKRDKSLSRLICTTQANLNILSGLALAHFNNDFPDIPIKLAGQYYIGHLFPMEFVELDIQGTALPEGTKRDVDLSGEKFIPRRSQLQVVYDEHGAVSQGLVDINVEKLTYGPVGRTLVYPVEPPSPPAPDDPPDGPWLPPNPPNPSNGGGDGNLLYFCGDTGVVGDRGHVFRTRNARASNPADVVYEDLGLVDGGSDVSHITLDSWDPKNCAMVTVSTVVVGPLCTGKIYKTTNLDDASPTWTPVYTSASRYIRMVASSICQQNLWVASLHCAGNISALWTTDGGASWSTLALTAVADGNTYQCLVETSSHNAQKAWITWMNNTGTSGCFQTTDQWATFTNETMLGNLWRWPANTLHRYYDNPTDQILMKACKHVAALCTANFGSCTGSAPGQSHASWLYNYTWGENGWWVLGGRPVLDVNELYISDDGLNWTLQYTFPGVTRYISGFSYNPNLYYACQDGVVAPLLISEDRGATFTPQTGNWAAICAAGGYTPDIACCVPVWVE